MGHFDPIAGLILEVALLSVHVAEKGEMALVESGLDQAKQPRALGVPSCGLLSVGSVPTGVGIGVATTALLLLMGKASGIHGLMRFFAGVALIAVYSGIEEERVEKVVAKEFHIKGDNFAKI